MPENSNEQLGIFRWVIILILLIVFAAISYGIVTSMRGANPSYPVWEIVVVVALLWLGYAVLVYIIAKWEQIFQSGPSF